jgi:hypothetical protein
MTIEELITASEKDLVINKDDLAHASVITPSIFHKYNRILYQEKLRLKKLESEFKTVFLKRWEFYKGKAEDAEYKKEQFFKKVLNADADKYLDGDLVLIEAKQKYDFQEEKVDCINRIMKQINERQWQIRNAIEFMKFQSGIGG